jgi:DNA (cytosine-5)-methyltransferase 1
LGEFFLRQPGIESCFNKALHDPLVTGIMDAIDSHGTDCALPSRFMRNWNKDMHTRKRSSKQPSAVSLFTGAGGMDVGFEAAGFRVHWANDFNEMACRTYERNHSGKIECGPIENFLPTLKQFEGVDLLFGGPPCQGFSVAGKMDIDDGRSQLVWRFLEAVEIVRPEVFVLENVKALAVLERWKHVRRKMFERTAELGYDFCVVLVNSCTFGVPQSRERMFLLGSRSKRNVRACGKLFFNYKERPETVRDVLMELGPAGSAQNQRICRAKVTIAARPVLRRSPYAGMLFNGQGRPLNPEGYSSTLHASMGGNKTPIIDEDHLYRNEPSWVEAYHSHLMRGGDPLPFDAAPIRLRRLTVDEAIRLQTFPADYDFVGSQSQVLTQIGNAVPCKLAHAVGRVAQDILSDEYEDLVSPSRLAHRADAQLELSIP